MGTAKDVSPAVGAEQGIIVGVERDLRVLNGCRSAQCRIKGLLHDREPTTLRRSKRRAESVAVLNHLRNEFLKVSMLNGHGTIFGEATRRRTDLPPTVRDPVDVRAHWLR